jgi:hypothetical protein
LKKQVKREQTAPFSLTSTHAGNKKGDILVDIYLHLPLRQLVQIGDDFHLQYQGWIKGRTTIHAATFIELDQAIGKMFPWNLLFEFT